MHSIGHYTGQRACHIFQGYQLCFNGFAGHTLLVFLTSLLGIVRFYLRNITLSYNPISLFTWNIHCVLIRNGNNCFKARYYSTRSSFSIFFFRLLLLTRSTVSCQSCFATFFYNMFCAIF